MFIYIFFIYIALSSSLIRIHVCDLPEKLDQLKVDFASRFVYCLIDNPSEESYRQSKHLSHARWSCSFPIVRFHHLFCRSRIYRTGCCGIWTMYADFSQKWLQPDCGLSATKVHAIVAGQTSVKSPEKAAFEKHLPQDVHIVSCHSLHGPTVSPVGQPLVKITFLQADSRSNYFFQIVIKHRASGDAVKLVESILRPLGSRHVHLSYDEHDRVTANTQAVTHAAFLR